MSDIPDARQCALPSCDREAVNPTRSGALCADHLDDLEHGPDQPDSPTTTPGGNGAETTTQGNDYPHDNPLDVSDVSDADRADMLREYLEAFVEVFGDVPRLMPLDDEGKAPIIQGRCPLDSPEGRSYLVDGKEAVRQIREDGARGFALYAGKRDHRTHDVVLVDVDDRDTFPYGPFPDTLEVLSGSGRGEHFTFRNGGDVKNAKGKDGVDGEVRAENWYCVVPGSVHPSGGVYHVIEDRDVAELTTDDVPSSLQPGSRNRDRDRTAPAGDADGDGDRPEDDEIDARLQAAFNNPHDGDRIEQVYNGKYSLAGFDDRSSAEYWLANRLDSWVACGDTHTVRRLMDKGNLQKWPDRPDDSYRDSVLADVGYQDWYYNPDDDSGKDPYQDDPRAADVVLDPERAWNAAGLTTPDDLDAELHLPTTDDGEAWRWPQGDVRLDDVARAVALADGLADSPSDPLREQYATAYERARERYGAPLPRYLTSADAVEHFDYVIGAVRELDYYHLDRDALRSDITAEGLAVAGQAQLALNPSWRDSDSGESVLVFPSGTVYDCALGEDGAPLDVLRFVALDAGLLDDPDSRLEGDAFTKAYRLTREHYGAPLPRWDVGTPDVTPVLPPTNRLVEDPTPEADRLDELRQQVEQLYGDLATDPEHAHLLRVLPALGKTTAAIKTAARQPTTYLAARKELLQQAAEKAETHGVSYQHLPVFSEVSLAPETLEAALDHVREHGKDRLRDLWAVRKAADGPLFDDDTDPDAEAELDRASCPTANNDHDEAWTLAVHVAYQLDYTPRDIHERAEALFGSELPCQEDGDCPYSEGWNDVADPDSPADLLIGNYVHGNVESARTYYTRDDLGHTDRDPRTLVVDEFPGKAYSETFGPEALDHAVWLASALRDDVSDRQDLLERDLWGDPFVQSWLQGEAADDGPLAPLSDTLAARKDLLTAVTTARELLDNYGDLLDGYDLRAPLERVTEGGSDLSVTDRATIAGEITTTIGEVPPGSRGFSVLQWIAEDVAEPLGQSSETDLDADLSVLPEDGELRTFVETALSAADDYADNATGLLEAARTALSGGDNGTRELAVWADHGYAHRRAHYLLEAVIRPGEDDVHTIEMTNYTFGSDLDATMGKQVDVREDVSVLLDRNHHGAVVHDPPDRLDGNGDPCPLVGLDATGREPLWSFALGEDVTARDVHDGPRDRAQCLREVHGLQLVQTTEDIKSYEGSPAGKHLDADVALLQEISSEFAGVHGARGRDGENVVLDDPAVITTKVVRDVLEGDDRAAGSVSEWENYGNLKGSNELRRHQLAAVLGCQHYGDHEIELVAALEGEEIDRAGYGQALDYGSDIANAYLRHMREDQVMQAALRFARGETGALVFAHTSALRRDLPVVGRGQVIETWNETATAIAREAQRYRDGRFSISDVADVVDVGRRQVRRVLAELVEAGYLVRSDPGVGQANEYVSKGDPGAGEVELDENLQADPVQPGQDHLEEYYTTNVRVTGVGDAGLPRVDGPGSTLPAPERARADGGGGPPPD